VTLRPGVGDGIVQLSTPTAGQSRQYIVFKNLVLDGVNCGSDCTGVSLGGGANGGTVDHIKLDGIEVKNVTGNGMSIGGDDGVGNFVWVTGAKMHDGGTAPGFPGLRHCWYVQGSDTLIEHSECYNWQSYGIHNYGQTVSPSRNVYRYNWIHNTGLYTSSTAFGILLTTGNNNQAYNNIVSGNQNGIA